MSALAFGCSSEALSASLSEDISVRAGQPRVQSAADSLPRFPGAGTRCLCALPAVFGSNANLHDLDATSLLILVSLGVKAKGGKRPLVEVGKMAPTRWVYAVLGAWTASQCVVGYGGDRVLLEDVKVSE